MSHQLERTAAEAAAAATALQASANTAPFPPPPLLTLQTCTIRPYHPADAAALAHHGNNPLIAQWMTNAFPHPYTLEAAHSWIAMNLPPVDPPPPTAAPAAETPTWPPLLHYAITLPSSPTTCIGTIGLKPGADIHARTADIGYWIGEAAWGRGIATEATAAFVAWAFEQVPGLERVGGSVYSGNDASARVLEKCGFVREGVLRRAVWKGVVVRDLEVWGLVRGEVGER